MTMITVKGEVRIHPTLPASKYGFHLLDQVGGVLRLLDVKVVNVAQLAQTWRKKTGQNLAVLERDGAVWVLRTA